jgi:beta-glucosidase
VCLVFISAMATEGWDRVGLHDDFSDGLILNVARKCANTVVIIHAAGVRLVDQWIDHPNVTATIIAHLPGQDSGTALVQLLYGEAEFSGKLPYTIPHNESDYGSVYAPCERSSPEDTDPQCDFTEGVYLDYRAFDVQDITPRYEFGFGLTYTSFEYSGLNITREDLDPASPCNGQHVWDTAAVVTTQIKNTGQRQGQEVGQLYLQIPNSPPRQLRGFEKVALAPGEEATVTFELAKRDFSVWDVVTQQWVVQEGEYAVFVGASSRDIRLTETFKV